jgi:hypothetical protein
MVKTLLHRVKDVRPLSERALSRGIVVVVVVVLHGDLWCNHAYACAQYHAARFLPVPSRQLCPNTILQPSIKASHIGRQPTQLHCALFASPVRIARKGAFNFLLSSQSLIMVRLCHLSNFRLPSASTSHLTAYSAQRASLSVLVSTCPFLYFCVSAHYREEGLV